MLFWNYRVVFRKLSNIYDGAFSQKQLTAFSCYLFLQKKASSEIIDSILKIRQG